MSLISVFIEAFPLEEWQISIKEIGYHGERIDIYFSGY